jgi:hypothetical protein
LVTEADPLPPSPQNIQHHTGSAWLLLLLLPLLAMPKRRLAPAAAAHLAVRQEMGVSRRKLSSETLRTLETLYVRTPYPSNDVIK